MKKIFILLASCVLNTVCSIPTTTLAQNLITSISQGHAHNDYLHDRPLLDALEAGFNSVEADIFLVDDQLLVAHTAREIDPERTLQKLYLDPLRTRVAGNQGHVWPAASKQPSPFWLLIDIKSEGLATYRRLHAVLEDYADMLTSVAGEQVSQGAIQIVISGNRPQEFIASQAKRYCGIDGRLGDLDSAQPAHLLPMISDNWGLHFRWRGQGAMPTSEQDKLLDIVQRAHARGRVVRLWATPEDPVVWQKLVESKVDWINTDKLSELRSFLSDSSKQMPLMKIPFEIEGHAAFVIDATKPTADRPWVWYAPTLGDNLPGAGHHWYFERFLAHGVSIAGIDLGEVRGSPASNTEFLKFYQAMVRRGYSAKPLLLGQSRGGLMMLSFAAEYPDKVGAFVGIYPVCNLSSWPLKSSKAATLKDYGLSEEQLIASLAKFNPVDRLAGLVASKVPMFTVHGDGDTVVPLEENSGLLRDRYMAAGGSITVKVIAGEGHKVSTSFFECQELVDFVIEQAAAHAPGK